MKNKILKYSSYNVVFVIIVRPANKDLAGVQNWYERKIGRVETSAFILNYKKSCR